jgi:hypothetical protein
MAHIGSKNATRKIQKQEINTMIDFHGSKMFDGKYYAIIPTHFVLLFWFKAVFNAHGNCRALF